MLFNFLRKKKEEENIEEKEEAIASITYYIKRGQASPMLDIELSDYDDESTKSLCLLLDMLGSESCYFETISMIKNCLAESGQEEMLNNILVHVASKAQTKLINIYKEKIKEEPCIKPSEVLR
jgi:superfamily II DNA or RNA helicase